MKIAAVVLVVIAIVAIEWPAMMRAKRKKDMAVFAILLLLGTVSLCDWLFRLNLPNPTMGITRLFIPVTDWLEKRLM